MQSVCRLLLKSDPSVHHGYFLDLSIRQRYSYSWWRISSVVSVCLVTNHFNLIRRLFQFSRTLLSSIAQAAAMSNVQKSNNGILIMNRFLMLAAASLVVGCSSLNERSTVSSNAHEGETTKAENSPKGASEAPEAEVVANSSDLGPIVYDKRTRATCNKWRRRTGSNIKIECDNNKSQPLRVGTFVEPPRVPTDSARPHN